MRVATAIREKLSAALSPERLEITDESHLHEGHAGARPEGESHFRVLVVAQTFTGMSRVERQRYVYQALAEELRDEIHALALTTLTPEESRRA